MTLLGKVVSSHLYRIRFTLEGKHLRASVTGYAGSLDAAIAYWRAIGDETRAVTPQSLLVIDQREGHALSETQTAQLLDAIRQFGLADVRMAYVETRLEHFPKAEAMDILAREKGFCARVFCNEMEAAVWLRHGE